MVIRVRRACAAGLVILALTGCGAGPAPREKGGGGELRVALPFEPTSLDPNVVQDEPALLVAPNLYSKLVALDADSRLFPDLAQGWTISEGGRRYTFHLRRGVRWHDGEPFSSGDVRWTLERLIRKPGLLGEATRKIERIETPDDSTAVIVLKEPWAPFLTTLAWFGGHILPRHLGGKRLDRPVGTGPFRFEEWVRGERITLTANLDFFRKGPYLDRLVYTFLADSSRVPGLLTAGKLDYSLVRPPLSLLPRLRKNPDLHLMTSASDGRYYCGFNLRRPPLNDRRVREAINRAIDRRALVDRALYGYGSPAVGFYTPSVAWAYNEAAKVPAFDRQRARELLAEAGLVPDERGVALELELLVAPVSPYQDIADLLRDQLRTVGIELRVTELPLAALLERTLARHDFDLALVAGSQGPDPENLNTRFGSRGATQFMGYESPELDAAVAEGARSVDLARRARSYFRAQEILARDLPIAPLIETVHLSLFRRDVRGLPQAEARGLVPANEYSLVRVTRGGGRW